MKYNKIIEILKEEDLLIDYTKIEADIKYLSYDSRDIKEDTLFFCKGFNFKEEYLLSIKDKITCYVSETIYDKDTSYILVNDVRKALAIISLNFYKDNLFKIGITGTKGKTTTNFYIHNILKHHLGYKPGILATQYFYDGMEGETHNTTPESLDLHRFLKTMSNNNLGYVSMEVASQATKLNRVYGMHFDIGCFLNIGEDHISSIEHKDFLDYLNCKIEFLTMCDSVIIYKQTDYYNDIIEKVQDKNIITFGFTINCDYYIKDIKVLDDKIEFTILNNNKKRTFYITMQGTFNCINATCAVIVSDLLNISDENIQKGLSETKVEGRMEVVTDDIGPIVVDFAHNRISAEAFYKSIKQTYKDKRIIAVFGCPGGRGMHRRRDMGSCAGEYADYIYLTADDPCGKNVVDICNDIVSFIKPKKPYEIIEDRKTAIIKALSNRKKDDVLVIIGKGSEVYQMAKVGYDPYQGDMNIVKEYISNKEGMLNDKVKC